MTSPLKNPMRQVRVVNAPDRAGKKYLIRTIGCQMNEHDSERIAGLLEENGMERTDDVSVADVVFINTCTVRENADNRMYGNIGQMKEWKDANPSMKIVVGGCAAQKDRELIRERAPWVDVVMGTHNLDRVVALLDICEESGPVVEILEEARSFPSSLPSKRESLHSAWVTIQLGCNNTCTYCVVPEVRGREMSRSPEDIIREVEGLVADGVVEVTLLGQNVDTYGRDLAIGGRRKPMFAGLLRRVGSVEGIRRVRFTSPHPNDFNREVAEAMAATPSVCEHLHFPLQSGSDKILARMHRGYGPKRFMEKLQMARDLIPDLSVSTDVIVGFPGESEEDFEATMRLIEEARFDSAFMFIFSPRPGTEAAKMIDEFVDPRVVSRRFDRLVAVQNAISAEKNQEMVGKRVEVLVEGPSRKNREVATTRSRGGKIVHVAGVFEPGTFLDVEISEAHQNHLVGELS